MRIGIDAMGGDRAPVEETKGALAARKLLGSDDRIVLVGDEPLVREQLDGVSGWAEQIEIRHAGQVIGMDESPVEALRSKPDSSIAVMMQMQADGELAACISAGNTGACVATAQMRLRRLRGVHRPGIAIVMPTHHGPVAICDVGANVNCRPQHLRQYGVMASIYVNAVCGVQEPRVGLLSIGREGAKGNELVKRAHDLLKDDPDIRFVGNVEGRDLFRGICDVVVCEGFVGNVVLKLMEGMAQSVIRSIFQELVGTVSTDADMLEGATGNMLAKYDFNEYGGAPLLGVSGICIICHGASNYRGIMNAVRAAADFSKHQVNQRITKLLYQNRGSVHG